MSYFAHDDHRIFYEESGSSSAEPLLLLHGNTVSGRFFAPAVPKLSEKYHVITMDFLGSGRSDRIAEWPAELWYAWARQAEALIHHLGYTAVHVIGCSGGALTAINLALECPNLVKTVTADSFEGLHANAAITEQIRIGRSMAK
ncbi:MAG: alpha/beta hydrolase [Clostridia bacterium]|nr:alpha/beta hydrolase [Clostridia bacterium]